MFTVLQSVLQRWCFKVSTTHILLRGRCLKYPQHKRRCFKVSTTHILLRRGCFKVTTTYLLSELSQFYLDGSFRYHSKIFMFFVAVFLGCTSTDRVGLCFFVVLCPGTPECSTGSGSGFKASQKTGQRLKVSSDRLREAGTRACDPKYLYHLYRK